MSIVELRYKDTYETKILEPKKFSLDDKAEAFK